MTYTIHTYVINLKEREERRQNILLEFENKKAFDLNIIDAIKCNNGAIGLWQTIEKIIHQAILNDYEMILICEDDHCFTKTFEQTLFLELVERANKYGADILLGGVSWFEDVIKFDQKLFWVSKFNGLQFTIIYKKFYQRILDAKFEDYDNADIKFSEISDKCFLIHPFISTQKEFGYSDVTIKNAERGWVTSLFNSTNTKLDQLNQVYKFYNLR